MCLSKKQKLLIHYFLICSVGLLLALPSNSQTQWKLEQIGTLPEPISNSAIALGYLHDTANLFVFGAIDSTLSQEGIHRRSYRFNLISKKSEALPELPDSTGKLGMAATAIGDTIYIVGGYHVLPDHSEITSNKVHRYRISENTFLPDGTQLPTGTDDHVQALHSNGTIAAVTGWNNFGNLRKAQFYSPNENTWTEGKQSPNTYPYKAFGAQGVFIGDTLLYFGGATSASGFAILNYLRKVHVDFSDLNNIEWSNQQLPTEQAAYRMAASSLYGNAVWVGGSKKTYNYDGLAYDGTGPVEAVEGVYVWNPASDALIFHSVPGLPMDLRNVGKMNDSTLVIAGGILPNHEVSNKVYTLTWKINSLAQPEVSHPQTVLFPNPAKDRLQVVAPSTIQTLEFRAPSGKSAIQVPIYNGTVNTSILTPGNYLVFDSKTKNFIQRVVVK